MRIKAIALLRALGFRMAAPWMVRPTLDQVVRARPEWALVGQSNIGGGRVSAAADVIG